MDSVLDLGKDVIYNVLSNLKKSEGPLNELLKDFDVDRTTQEVVDNVKDSLFNMIIRDSSINFRSLQNSVIYDYRGKEDNIKDISFINIVHLIENIPADEAISENNLDYFYSRDFNFFMNLNLNSRS